MRSNRSVLTAAAFAALAMGATTALASPASAAPNTTPQKVCGSAYKTVNSAPIGSLGTVYLTYNSSNGKNCVATIRKNPGAAVDMSTWIYIPDTGDSAEDYGHYTSYAGPAYVYGKALCVNWGGHINNIYTQVSGSNCAALKENRVTFTR
ncbi:MULTISPECIES: spore-associated protein [Streptomyces]|uniref:spore-associated protein n=1 Tax=unclassified Streptomyces TaxID=2593676 RepID=UPI001C2E20B2|nr:MULTISPECIES: spore-associated protein [Streptomyces]MBV1938538.1 spore-associated protein [Streptomyces sp. BV286]WAU81939.1 spore-associated protein [Streptomyces aurantiacus]